MLNKSLINCSSFSFLKMPIVEDVKNELFVSNVVHDGSVGFFYEYIVKILIQERYASFKKLL